MFNYSIVSSGLSGLVGYRQPYNPEIPTLTAPNTTTRSGLYINDNPLAKLEYVYDCQDYDAISDADFNTYLNNAMSESIVNVCSNVFNKSSYIDRQVLYKNALNKVESETLPAGFIGYKIGVSSEKNVAFEIKRILLDFEGSGDIELLLFNTSVKAPIQTKVITISTDHKSEDLSWVVDNSGNTYKGDYYLGYISSYVDIGTLKPYKRDWNNANIESIITYLGIEKGNFPAMTTNVLADLDDWDGTDITTGLNPDITVYEDYTDLILNNEKLFSRAILLDSQIRILSEVMASIRSNKNERIGKDLLSRVVLELDGADVNGIKKESLRGTLSREIKRVANEINKIREGYFGGNLSTITMM